jgi:hypothetical protein
MRATIVRDRKTEQVIPRRVGAAIRTAYSFASDDGGRKSIVMP